MMPIGEKNELGRLHSNSNHFSMLCLEGIEDPSVKLNIEQCDGHFGLHLKLFFIFHFVLEC